MKKRMLEMARRVQSAFRGFYLGGGTALMFKYHHRVSHDLDFLKAKPLSLSRTVARMKGLFPLLRWEQGVDNLDFFTQGIKVSFVHFPFPNVLPLEVHDGVATASDFDLFLNKVYASGRRIEPKDPFDAAYLYRLHRWDPAEIKDAFERKFSGQSYELYLGALLSFEDYEPLEGWVKQTLQELLS
jgi:predicted nucleotidyltransferase component of viral defense system